MAAAPHGLQNGAGVSTDALQKMERHISELPLLPQVLVKILQLSPTADDYFERFEELAQEDPAFAVRIVALANSTAFAPTVPICNIRDALTRIGAGTVSSLVASLSVQRVFMPQDAAQTRLWKHAIKVAVAAQRIAQSLPQLKVATGEAYLIGLLHDIGRFVMLEHAAPELQKVDESNWQSPEELIQADKDIYTFTHSELGYLACKRWGLPDVIANVVRTHHEPFADDVSDPLTAAMFCVQVADRMDISLLGRTDLDGITDGELHEQILDDCLKTETERALLPATALQNMIPGIRSSSNRLLSGLGFA